MKKQLSFILLAITLIIPTTLFLTACKKAACTSISCNTHGGTCINGKCECFSGYEGTDCSIMTIDKYAKNYVGQTTPNSGSTWSSDGNNLDLNYLIKSVVEVNGIGYAYWETWSWGLTTKKYKFDSYTSDVYADIDYTNGKVFIRHQKITRNSGINLNYEVNGFGQINLSTKNLDLQYTTTCVEDTSLNTTFHFNGYYSY